MLSYLFNVIIWIDQGVNVIFSPLLNLMVDKQGARFGDPDETLSSVMGKNSKRKTCKVCNWICRNILHPIDRNHCENSIED